MNPVSELNELRQGLAYKLKSRTGSDHDPVFTVTVEVDRESYLGQGRSKKLARKKAAEEALKQLKHNTKRTSDCLSAVFSYQKLNDDLNDCISSDSALDLSKQKPQNPIVLLNELRPGTVYKLKSRTGLDHDPVFTVAVKVDGKQYMGQGRSKQLARAKASEAALKITNSYKQTLDDGTVGSNGVSYHSTQDPPNAATTLNEVRPGLFYELKSRTGTDHEPTFTMTVEVDGKEYMGRGRSKKLARIEAADAALEKLITSCKAPVSSEGPASITYSLNPRNALSKLNELCHGLVYHLESRTGPDHEPVFTMTVTVDGVTYVGQGKTKKLACIEAAEDALRKLNKFTDCSVLTDNKPGFSKDDELVHTLAKAIFNSVLERFFTATANKNVIKYRKYKVLAGIVMTENLDLKTAKVISVTTGTKCIEGKYLSRDGTKLNDSHAEIVARRCLMDFLYSQLELHKTANTGKDSIFVRPSTPDQLYKLKEGIQFHLFIDTAPCGDARVFSPEKTMIRIDKHPNRTARGLLRTKIEAGEGTIPVENSNNTQTWDEVMRGQRLLTMSCSDKIARWNIVGVQGAMLSSVIEPIYFYSIVLGSSFHPHHIYRAVCGRVESSIESRLPLSYLLNKPKFALVTCSDARNEIKAPNFGINWTINEQAVEVVDSSTGRTVYNNVSRLTKQKFFARYANLIKQLPNLRIERKITRDYRGTKEYAHDYQIAKHELFAAFRLQSLGSWLKKPIELDTFSLLAYQPMR